MLSQQAIYQKDTRSGNTRRFAMLNVKKTKGLLPISSNMFGCTEVENRFADL